MAHANVLRDCGSFGVLGDTFAAMLLVLLQCRGHPLSPTVHLPAVAEEARQHCYVACDYHRTTGSSICVV
jgi:hypothetical protein